MDLHPSWREYGIRPAHEVFEELTRERDELRAENQRMANRVGEVEGWVLGLTAEMDELRAALAPFARCLDPYADEPGIDAMQAMIRLDDVREARRVLGLASPHQ